MDECFLVFSRGLYLWYRSLKLQKYEKDVVLYAIESKKMHQYAENGCLSAWKQQRGRKFWIFLCIKKVLQSLRLGALYLVLFWGEGLLFFPDIPACVFATYSLFGSGLVINTKAGGNHGISLCLEALSIGYNVCSFHCCFFFVNKKSRLSYWIILASPCLLPFGSKLKRTGF